MNFDYEENGGMKCFSCKSKESNCVSQCGEQDCSANNKRYGDYYEYPSLTHFTDEFQL